MIATEYRRKSSPRSTKTNWKGCIEDREKPTTRPTSSMTRYRSQQISRRRQRHLSAQREQHYGPDEAWHDQAARMGFRSPYAQPSRTWCPSASTNITIGAQWGMALLVTLGAVHRGRRPGERKFRGQRRRRYLIMLTDGTNTKKRAQQQKQARSTRVPSSLARESARRSRPSIRSASSTATTDILKKCASKGELLQRTERFAACACLQGNRRRNLEAPRLELIRQRGSSPSRCLRTAPPRPYRRPEGRSGFPGGASCRAR